MLLLISPVDDLTLGTSLQYTFPSIIRRISRHHLHHPESFFISDVSTQHPISFINFMGGWPIVHTTLINQPFLIIHFNFLLDQSLKMSLLTQPGCRLSKSYILVHMRSPLCHLLIWQLKFEKISWRPFLDCDEIDSIFRSNSGTQNVSSVPIASTV